MKEYREVGLEREFFLLRKDRKDDISGIVEPIEFEFPADIFGFLVELRSEPWMHLNTVKMTWDIERSYWEHRADKFGMELVDLPYLEVPREKAEYFFNKYGGDIYEDLTKNIYNHEGSHHLGMFIDKNCDEALLTAGMHVHFSNRDETGKVINFTNDQIEDIVRYMDNVFEKEIKEGRRLAGEWEPKKHGFEYRSLPCNVDIYKVLKHSFKIIREI